MKMRWDGCACDDLEAAVQNVASAVSWRAVQSQRVTCCCLQDFRAQPCRMRTCELCNIVASDSYSPQDTGAGQYFQSDIQFRYHCLRLLINMQSHHAPGVAIVPNLREEQEHRAHSRAAGWRHGIRGSLDKKIRLANRMCQELGEMMGERRRKREAEKVRKYKSLELRARKRPTQEKSRLLSLPAEIRVMIWEYAMTGQFIVLYRKRGKVTSSVFDSHGTTSVTNATVSIMTSIAMSKAESGAMALPLTCTTT